MKSKGTYSNQLEKLHAELDYGLVAFVASFLGLYAVVVALYVVAGFVMHVKPINVPYAVPCMVGSVVGGCLLGTILSRGITTVKKREYLTLLRQELDDTSIGSVVAMTIAVSDLANSMSTTEVIAASAYIDKYRCQILGQSHLKIILTLPETICKLSPPRIDATAQAEIARSLASLAIASGHERAIGRIGTLCSPKASCRLSDNVIAELKSTLGRRAEVVYGTRIQRDGHATDQVSEAEHL